MLLPLGESLHLQSDARLAVYKIRLADSFLSTDRGRYLYCRPRHAELGAAARGRPHGRTAGHLDQLQLCHRAATYSETTNSLSVAYDGNRLILNDLELRQLTQRTTPPAWIICWARVSGGPQVFEFVRMMARNKVYRGH